MKIQRVPRGLINLLSMSGGATPAELLEKVQPTLDLMQLYGLTQLQLRSDANAALAEGNVINIVVPNSEAWVLFSISGRVVKTATMTALRAGLMLGPAVNEVSTIVSEELGPFGATETGNVRVCFYAPYPRLLMPGSCIGFSLEVLGTDANADCAINCQVGILG